MRCVWSKPVRPCFARLPIAHHTGFTPNACVTGNIRHACLVTAVCVVGRDWIRVANMRLFDVLSCRVGSGKVWKAGFWMGWQGYERWEGLSYIRTHIRQIMLSILFYQEI